MPRCATQLFIAFTSELIGAYSDAVVVLVERDIKAWYKDFDRAIIANLYNPVLKAIANLTSRSYTKLVGRWNLKLEGTGESEPSKCFKKRPGQGTDSITTLSGNSRLQSVS